MRTPRWIRWVAGILGVVTLLMAGIYALYVSVDPEKLEIDSSVRDATPGKFVRLGDGFTHYELAGPSSGRVVVLAAGASVPYYIWDPTFAALTDAGFCVLRYDYYGRGFSDRADIAYTQDLYVRQLSQLLDALHITDSIDLAGLSFGGSVITSFADRYPDRVRSLVYMDPGFLGPRTPLFMETIPSLWNITTAIFVERTWADGQLDDFYRPERFPDWPQRYRVQLQYKGFRRARLSELVSNAGVDQTEEVRRVGMHPRPVLVIWGKQDNNVPFENSEWLMMQMPHGRLLAVDSAGHLPQWEQPGLVHSEWIRFLRQ